MLQKKPGNHHNQPFTLEEYSTGMLVLQPTGFCNIDCRYCYLADRTTKTRMSDEVITASITMLVENNLLGEHLSVVWHAGEPLVLPVTYYENAIEIVRKLVPESCAITHYFQTNATLITPAWCEILGRPDVSVGVSMDGPKRLHDLNRITRSGKGTYDTVMKGISCLQDHGIAFHVISVLTRQALFFPDEFFEFYCGSGIEDICFNIEEVEGINTKSTLSVAGTDLLYRQFMTRFLDRAASSDHIKRLREFAQAHSALFEQSGTGKTNDQALPLAIVSVASNGSFSTYSPELLGLENDRFGDFTLGNVLSDQLSKVMQSDKFRAIDDEIKTGVEACRAECPYFTVCGGGAPANKIFETGSFAATETMFCRMTIKAATDIVLQACQDGVSFDTSKSVSQTL